MGAEYRLQMWNWPWNRLSLNVHEAPNGFRWKHIQGVNDLAVVAGKAW